MDGDKLSLSNLSTYVILVKVVLAPDWAIAACLLIVVANRAYKRYVESKRVTLDQSSKSEEADLLNKIQSDHAKLEASIVDMKQFIATQKLGQAFTRKP